MERFFNEPTTSEAERHALQTTWIENSDPSHETAHTILKAQKKAAVAAARKSDGYSAPMLARFICETPHVVAADSQTSGVAEEEGPPSKNEKHEVSFWESNLTSVDKAGTGGATRVGSLDHSTGTETTTETPRDAFEDGDNAPVGGET
jgi:hypothetical protein